MKQVIFKKLTIRNFLSIGDEPVSIDFGPGLHVITGSNIDKPERKNAVGKTTILNGFYWSIFGNTIDGLKKDLIINNVVGGTAECKLTFDVITSTSNNSYEIIRRLNPSNLTFTCNGVDKTRDSIANTNDYICEVLSASPQLFQNCVVMTINNTIPFMAKSKTDKRKFIEDIFSLEIFSQMVQTVRGQYNEITKKHEIERSKYTELCLSLNNLNEQKQSLIEQKKQKVELYKKRQKDNEAQLKLYNKEINSIEVVEISVLEEKKAALEAGEKNLESQISDMTSKITASKLSRAHEQTVLQNIGTDKDLCPTCLKPITSDDIDHIKEEKVKISKKIDDITNALEKLEIKKKHLTDKKSKIQAALQQVNKKITQNFVNSMKIQNLTEKIEQIKEWQKTLVDDIAECISDSTEFDSALADVESRIKVIEGACVELKKEISKLDVAKFILSDEGVKSYIVKILLDQLNSRLLYYLNKLDSNCICYFDEFFEEEILNERKRACSYFNFSGAEKKSIDIACMFAFSDIKRMQGGVKYNVTFYDELFDTSFDEKGIELVVGVLKERVEKYNEGCYIISHQKGSVKNVTGQVIYLEKMNDITRRVEIPEGMFN
jgi:DNA repair exonuclease SbcCD ATPase subunit